MDIVSTLVGLDNKDFKLGDKVIVTSVDSSAKHYNYEGLEFYISKMDEKDKGISCLEEDMQFCSKSSTTKCIYLSDTKYAYDDNKTREMWTCCCTIRKSI